MPQVPTIGRIVHITQKGSPEHLPAFVVYVHPPGAHRSNTALDGTLLNVGCWDVHGEPTPGIQGIPEDQTGAREQSWHWPERTDTGVVSPVPTAIALEDRIRVLEDLLISDKAADDDPEIEDDDDEDTVDYEAVPSQRV